MTLKELQMTLKEWMDKYDIRETTVVKKLQNMAGSRGCTEFAVRKWITGERIPRPKMQATIMKFTAGRVTPNDWVLGAQKNAGH
jgi:hypothetical protein